MKIYNILSKYLNPLSNIQQHWWYELGIDSQQEVALDALIITCESVFCVCSSSMSAAPPYSACVRF
jgi:hypothetical protein